MQTAADTSQKVRTAPTTASRQAAAAAALARRQAVVLRALSELLDGGRLDTSLMALADELQRRFKCERVAVGVCEGDTITLRTISRQATFDPRSNDARMLSEAMREACDQDRAIHWRADLPDAQDPVHRQLGSQEVDRELFTIPLTHEGAVIGALHFSRIADAAWSNTSLELLGQVATICAPVLSLRMHKERPLRAQVADTSRRWAGQIFGREHLATKLGGLVLATLLGVAALVTVADEVGAPAELLPTHKRLITAPFAGYIDRVHVDSGDAVTPGMPLITLDTRDLQLEHDTLSSELASISAEFRSAMASRDRKEMAISQARQQQAEAKLRLIEARIQRASITAPEAGMVTSGELRQSLGAPVERGDTLLEITPGAGYKVVLWTDEADVGSVHPGQTGRLSMRSSPADGMDFKVTRIHPIATPGEGKNRFRVEATLLEQPQGLRPGHTGYGKISAGETSLLWKWTRGFVRWARQTYWEWFG